MMFRMEKDELRQKLKTKRLAMSASEVLDASQIIVQKLIKNIDWSNIKSAHIYKSIKSLNEVDTGTLIDYLKTYQPRIKLTIGLKTTHPIPTEKFDLVVAPMLAFDKNCNRLGWGGGWYDRFLITQPQAIKIGLAYASSEVKLLSTEPHDIRLDKIITEEGIMG